MAINESISDWELAIGGQSTINIEPAGSGDEWVLFAFFEGSNSSAALRMDGSDFGFYVARNAGETSESVENDMLGLSTDAEANIFVANGNAFDIKNESGSATKIAYSGIQIKAG